MATAIPCPCGHKSCKAWMVDPHAAVQGVRFTQEEAERVAEFLNGMPDLTSTKFDWPDGGIVCFHCGIRFVTPGSARKHFGETPSVMVACCDTIKRAYAIGVERGQAMGNYSTDVADEFFEMDMKK